MISRIHYTGECDFGLDDDAIFIAQPDARAMQRCPYAADCTGARIPPQGSTDPSACEAIEWCGMRQQLDSGAAERVQHEPPPLRATQSERQRSLKPEGMAAADWDKLKKQSKAQAHRRKVERMARAGGQRRSAYRTQWGGTLSEWEADRPTYGKVMHAVHELSARAPEQWGRAIQGLVKLPQRHHDIERWHGATEAMETLADFDEQHGKAIEWTLTDDDIRQRAHDLARRVEGGVARIFKRYGVTEKQAIQVKDRLAACAEYELATTGKTEKQVMRETGRDPDFWRECAAMSNEEKTTAGKLLQRMAAALREAVDYVAHKCALHECDPPKLRKRSPTTAEVMAAIKRAQDDRWWRRALRRAAARIVEAGAIKIGMVGKRSGGYASDEAVKRRAQQLARNAAGLASTMVRNEAGQIFTLKELAHASVANPVNRGGELMTRIRGCEEYADANAWVGLFITLTCPSAMHAMLSKEWRDKGIAATSAQEAGQTIPADTYRAVPNPRYDGTSTPRDAQSWLVKQWGKARAAMARKGLQPFGFRVAEPHHDGTPHWHLLLWCKDDAEAKALQDLLYRYWVVNDKHYAKERGAAKSRTNFKSLTKGGAAGYIAKYIAKSIGHHALKEHLDESETGDLFTVEMGGVQGHVRVDAWASCWGIRQFQAIGQPSVSVWREVRRIKEDQFADMKWGQVKHVRMAWYAAQKLSDQDQADWAGYIRAMGGVALPRGDYNIQLAFDLSRRTNRYGEAAKRGRLFGVRDRLGRCMVSRRLFWTRITGSEGPDWPECALAKARLLRGETPQTKEERAARGAPWTGLNNCTARLTEGHSNWLYKERDAQAKAQKEAENWAYLASYLAPKYTRQLELMGATPQELKAVQPLHARELMKRMGMSFEQVVSEMTARGLLHAGPAYAA
ncbi:replication endonuclease [Ottowia sp.]|uniref:replication endonuclease n=1 Tax=Ottowia sp. TaxID=1898956 RepID=UPI003A87B038